MLTENREFNEIYEQYKNLIKYFFMAVYNGKKCGIKLQEKA